MALLSGAALGLGLPRPGLCVLAWFALAPLLWLCEEAPSWKRAFTFGFLGGVGFNGTALSWVYPLCRFAGLPPVVGFLAWSALAVFLGLLWGLIGALGRAGALRRPSLAPWAWAILWTAAAAAAERWTPRLSIDFLAYTQWRHLALLQISSLAGPHALGFLIVAVNAALLGAWRASARPQATVPGAVLNASLAAALLALCWGYGLASLAARPAPPPERQFRVELLQPAIHQYQKFDEQHAQRILDGFDELLARPRAGAPALILWPETSIPRWVTTEGGLPEAAAWSRKLGSHQIVGAMVRAGGLGHNSAIHLGPDGETLGAYHKRELVPFGEYQPLGFLERFIGILAQMGGLTAGDRVQPLLQTPLGPAAVSICYEALFPRWARLDVSQGAKLFVNVTNDGWYGRTSEPYQHFEANRYRAIENRIPVLRVSNSGISGVIDPWGVVTAKLDLGERGRLDAEVPEEDPFPRRSFYARHGDWLAVLCLLATPLLLL